MISRSNLLIDGGGALGQARTRAHSSSSKAAQKTLLVQAVRSVAVEKVVLVLDAAKKLGVGRLGIGVSPEG